VSIKKNEEKKLPIKKLSKKVESKQYLPLLVGSDHQLYTGNCLKVLKQIPDNTIKLVITDPPYNINLDYNKYKDNKTWKKYYFELGVMIKEIERILTPDGSFYLINYPELNARTIPFFDETSLTYRSWLTWHYPTNIGHSKRNYTRSQRSILFYTKSKKKYTFNRNQILQPYKNPNDKRVRQLIKKGSTGRTPYDTLTISDLFETMIVNTPDVLNINLLKNVSKDRSDSHPCQLPLELIRNFIKVSSNSGDTILDCYAGTFTTSFAAKELGRKSIGIEIDPKYVKIGYKRLTK